MSEMPVDILIPFTSSDPLRLGAFARVHAHLCQLGWPIRLAGDTHDPFRRSYAVNHAAEQSSADVLLLNDADMICPLAQIRAAVSAAGDHPGLVFAFTEYVRVDEPSGVETIETITNTNGCVAIRHDCFFEIGGYDERFIGWALEDKDFNDRADERWGLRRIAGRSEHLWHGERRADDSCLETSAAQVAANRRLYEEKRRARFALKH